jgi:PRTRC genetic system protein E
MFTQLMPLIQNRALTLTVAAVSPTEIRVNIVPQPKESDKKANDEIGYSHSKEVAKIPEEALRGLTTPLCVTGTPEEIDAQLVETLSKFTSLHVGLRQSLDAAAAVIKESVKAIDERERLKKEKAKANSTKPAAPKAEEEKKQAEDTALPLLFTTQGQRAEAVSANDKPNASGPTSAGSPGDQNVSSVQSAGEEEEEE